MKKLNLLVIVAFLLILPFSHAATEYNQSGSDTGQYQLGTGFFNDQLTDTQIFSKSLTSGRFMPLVADLDNNGINEIIVLDDDSIELYQNKELDLITGLTLQMGSRTSNIIIFDIDGDGNREIILATEAAADIPRMYILQWNGTDLINESSFRLATAGLDHTNGEIMLNCRATNDCLIAYANKLIDSDEGSTAAEQSVEFFNSTSFGGVQVSLDSGTGASAFCYPKFQNIITSDYDNDGDVDYVFTNFELGTTASAFRLHIFYVDVTGVTPSEIRQITLDEVNGLTRTGGHCGDDNYGRFITSPLVMDLDTGKSGLETVVGFMQTDSTFKMHSYDATGASESAAFIDDYPEFFTADGEIISNVQRADVFSDGGNNAFCVLGHDASAEELDLLCASEATSSSPETLEFKYSIDGQFNITQDFDELNAISHSGQHSTVTTTIGDSGTSNPSEFINAYGVFKIEDTTFNGSIFVKTLTRIFDTPRDDTVLISIDVEKETAVGGREDLLLLSDTNLFYVDDKFTNSGATISSYTIQPCIDSTWKLNTSVSITITPTDIDSDNVAAKATLYRGDSNEQDTDFSINVSSGTEISIGGLTANKTIGVGNLRLQARDTGNPSEIDTIDVVFSVGANGVSFGDCTTEVDIVAEAEAAAVILNGTLTQDATDNSVITGVTTFINLTGLAGTTIWLILMIAFSLGIFFRAAELGWSGNASLGAVAAINALFIILGARLGIISTSLVVIIVIIGVVILGVFLGSYLTGARTEAA